MEILRTPHGPPTPVPGRSPVPEYDLDLDAVEPPERPRNRAVPGSFLLVAVLIGAILGAGATQLWNRTSREAELKAQTTVVALPRGWSSLETLSTADGQRHASGTIGLRLLNVGPRPVEVGQLLAEEPGLRLTGPPEYRRLLSQGMTQLTVAIELGCPPNVALDEVVLQLTVRTEDGVVRHTDARLPYDDIIDSGSPAGNPCQ